MEFMFSEESEQDEEETRTGPSRRHIKLLQWKSTKLRNITGGVRTTIALHHGRNKKWAHLHRDAVECRSSECVVVL